MAFALPDGSKVFIGTTLGTAVPVTTLSNANPAVATSAAHGFAAADEILVKSGWEDANDSIYRVVNPTTNNFVVDGLNSADTTWFSPNTGTGTAQKITAWTEIQQIISISASGGDAQFANVELLSRRNAINIPTRFNATTLALTIADDITLPGYQALVAASRSLQTRAIKFAMSGGSVAYGFGYIALSEMPQLNKGQVNTVQCSISLLGRFTRFQA